MMKSRYLLRHTVPNLVIAQRVLRKMAAAASQYMADETGEAMVGLLVPGDRTNGIPTLYVLDTISPDESAVRQLHTFQQGDERQDEIIWWLQENWRAYREKRRARFGSPLEAKWDVPLRYLGDWHKQPGYMIQPSTGDQLTALDWLDDEDNNMDFLLAPIVTLGHPSTILNTPHTANFLAVPYDDGSHLRADFWYIHRDVRLFQPIIPAVYPDDQLPSLPDYPWHLVDQRRADLELARLHGDGLFTSVILWEVNDQPPLEICFLTARMGADRVLIICTPWNYPQARPTARIAPFVHLGPDDDLYSVFADLWAQSESVDDPPGWGWTPDTFMLDYIRALETALGIQPAPPASAGDSQQAETAAADEVAATEDES
jgi:hypothetical protein